ncbi:calcineurin-like metallo-phosphoesterase super family protein [Striga asiatica]|uniref:Calcineurin-like metallo-phosphoesterase super family protein n=1 Tax=Striga asiatica TaxID=4170 RepID=A0A5A7RDR4_STRAF|nr:calcineurin-like metallo-phosphoesterase super family protein [Striga asiatica]
MWLTLILQIILPSLWSLNFWHKSTLLLLSLRRLRLNSFHVSLERRIRIFASYNHQLLANPCSLCRMPYQFFGHSQTIYYWVKKSVNIKKQDKSRVCRPRVPQEHTDAKEKAGYNFVFVFSDVPMCCYGRYGCCCVCFEVVLSAGLPAFSSSGRKSVSFVNEFFLVAGGFRAIHSKVRYPNRFPI